MRYFFYVASFQTDKLSGYVNGASRNKDGIFNMKEAFDYQATKDFGQLKDAKFALLSFQEISKNQYENFRNYWETPSDTERESKSTITWDMIESLFPTEKEFEDIHAKCKSNDWKELMDKPSLYDLIRDHIKKQCEGD